MPKICAISDTHSYHRKLVIPECDLLIHAGDITWKGELDIIEDFSNWLKELPIKHKIIVMGNHEIGLENSAKGNIAIKMIEGSGAIYLENTSTIIDGLKIHGSPCSPFFHNWQWNRHRGKDIAAEWAKIPNDVDILITHSPPYMILDEVPRGVSSVENVGCKDLLERIDQLKQLKLNVFGHIHEGASETPMERYGVKYVNASSCNKKYEPINKPVVIDL